MNTTVYVIGTDFTLKGILDTYKSFIWTDRYDGYGDFELDLLASTEYVNMLAVGNYIEWANSDKTMIIESVQINTDSEDGDELIVSGRSLESILDRRVIWTQSIFDTTLHAAIKSLITSAIISPSDSARRISNFTFEDSTDAALLALTVDTQFEAGDNLYETIESLCVLNGVGFQVKFDANHNMVFKLYLGKDRRTTQSTNAWVIFSPNYDSLYDSNYATSTKEYKNVMLIGGEGEGSSKIFETATSGTSSGLSRREVYYDNSGLSSNDGEISESDYRTQLKESGEAELAQYAVTTSFDGEIVNDTIFVYGTDFSIGDIVELENAYGITKACRVSEYIRSVDVSGIQAYPTLTDYI